MTDWIQTCVPPELLPHIFGCLSRKDLASCRLVSRTFCHSSTKLLFARVVVATRLDALQNLFSILNHPEKRTLVRELVWDASFYDRQVGYDLEDYVEACLESKRTFCDKLLVDEDEQLMRLCHNLGLEAEAVPLQQLSIHDMDPLLYDDDHMHASGMRRGQDVYFRRYMQQERIKQFGMHLHNLELAIDRLPNLRRIVYTDFTYLAASGEGFEELCIRLFGNTLEPSKPVRIEGRPDVDFDNLKSYLTRKGKSELLAAADDSR